MTGKSRAAAVAAGTFKDSGSFSEMSLIVKWIGSMTRLDCFMSLFLYKKEKKYIKF